MAPPFLADELLTLLAILQFIINLNNSRLLTLRLRKVSTTRILTLLGHERLDNPGPRGPYCRLKVDLLLEVLHHPDQLKKHFRLNILTFHKLRTLITSHHRGWDEDIQLLCFLFWLACGAAYRVVSAATGIPRSSVCDIVHNVLDRVLAVIKTVIKLPTAEECPAISNGFSQLAKTRYINKAVGSIDGTHIKIMPPDSRREDYINHKLFYSINMQSVCDHKGVFLDVFAGYPGSVHDSRVFKCSPFYRQRNYPPNGYYIIGDTAYPCSLHPIPTLTPYKQPDITPVQARFNYHLSSARTIIERSFGRMKTRWRSIFTKTLEISPVLAPKVAVACAILHNVCIMADDEWGQDEDGEEEDLPNDQPADEPAVVPRQESGEPLRGRIAAQISAPQEVPHHLFEHDYM